MRRTTPGTLAFAGRIIDHQAAISSATRIGALPPFPVLEALQPHLVNLMGRAGFRALLARSLELAKSDVRWLRSVHVNADGVCVCPSDLEAQVGSDDFLNGRVVLVAEVVALLVAFIGEALTLRVVSEVWPKLSLTDLHLGKGEEYAKTH